MQAAYWVGRSSKSPLCGVSAHLYAEFDGASFDPEKLEKALAALAEKHPMCRLRVTADGRQEIAEDRRKITFSIEDLRSLSAQEITVRLAEKRQQWTNQKLDLSVGEAIAFGLSLLPGDKTRLHVDSDMIAIDPVSFCLLMDDLANFYLGSSSAHQAKEEDIYFNWLDEFRRIDSETQRGIEDRKLWKSRLADVPPAPSLPPFEPDSLEPRSDRLSHWLTPDQRKQLSQVARNNKITLSTLMLGLFAVTLQQATKDTRFRLNVPMFWREPTVQGVEKIAGEFANVLVLGVEFDALETLEQFCARIGEEMWWLLSHSAYPGVNVMRDLSRQRGDMQLMPVVFTNGLDLPGGDLFSPKVHDAFGKMEWVISQGPHVALDAQAAAFEGGILINWDVRTDTLPETWIKPVFERYIALIKTVAEEPAHMERSATSIFENKNCVAPKGKNQLPTADLEAGMTAPLSPLQKAYLMGRSEHLPLGGVAMQDFREYRGHIDVETLRLRLENTARRHACLRKVIDTDALTETISDAGDVNLEILDFRSLNSAEAQSKIDSMREDFAHRLFPLDRPPWQITAFLLPEESAAATEEGSTVLFVRFDALIVDGRSISALIAELLTGNPMAANNFADAMQDQPDPVKRQSDAHYWTEKLSSVASSPQLPWKKPLSAIGVSRYERASLTISKPVFKNVYKAGAKSGLFKNTALTAVILEVLSRWLSEGELCTAIPVAPQAAAAFTNNSSFVAVNWRPSYETFCHRAKALQDDIVEALDHLSFSGVDINRLLMNRRPGELALPVVITNGLSWQPLDEAVGIRQTAGLTQTPQVAMDVRFSLNSSGDLLFDIDYAKEAIEQTVVEDILAAIGNTLHAVSDRDKFEVKQEDIVSRDADRFNQDRDKPVCSNFLRCIGEKLFVEPPEKDALICGERHISYRELGENVGRTIAALRSRGIARGNVVAICLPRDPDHLAVTLACALTGAIWVPIDAASPEERLSYLLQNCRPDLVVCGKPVEGYEWASPADLGKERPESAFTIAPDELDGLSSSPDASYYLYTSGTTGRPKCVVLSNLATSNVIGQTIGNWRVTERDVLISVTPLHHDMSVFDVFGSLSAGATLVLPSPGEEKDAIAWNRLSKQHGVTIWCSVPAILEMLLSCAKPGDLKSLRLVAQGGDYIKPAVIAQLRAADPQLRLVSLGGPTETTIWSIWHEIGPQDTGTVPYGKPLAGNSYFILNENGEHCPPQVEGRIHTAGINVALGYLEEGQLNQNEFVTVIDEEGQPVRAFRTGDKARYRPDGTIIFAGRVNGYVKVRGVRVSLPDIEAELVKHPDIRQALVVDYGEEKQGEAAIGLLYTLEKQAAATSADIRTFARGQLPPSHIPSRYVVVDDLPLSANGKPDRHAARRLIAAADGGLQADVPASVTQTAPDKSQRIIDLYLGVLQQNKNDKINEVTDFVDIGLLPSHLGRISKAIGEEFGVELSPRNLLTCRNASQVARLLP